MIPELTCQACGVTAPRDAHHCLNCGSADWRPLAPEAAPVGVVPPPDPKPSTRRERRNHE